MNKSKILKRSLAVILAMMMIFAMIPLSASAADAFVNDEGIISIAPVANAEITGTKPTYDMALRYDNAIATTAQTFTAAVDPNKVDAVKYEVNGGDTQTVTPVGGTATFTLAAGTVVPATVKIRAYKATTQVGAELTVNVTLPAKSTDTSLKKATIPGPGTDFATIEGAISGNKIEFTVPWGYTNVSTQNVSFYLNNPTTTDPQVPTATVPAVTRSPEPMTVTSQQGSSAVYYVSTKEYEVLTSMTVAGTAITQAVDANGDPVADTYDLVFPEGTKATDLTKAVVDIKTTSTIKVDAIKLDKKSTGDATTALPANKEFDFSAAATGADVTYMLTLTGPASAGALSKTFTIKAHTAQSNDATIKSFTATTTVGGNNFTNEGTVADETLSVGLANGSAANNVKVDFVAAPGAKVTIAGKDQNADTTGSVPQFTIASDITAGVLVTVTAPDGKTVKRYQLSGTIAETKFNNPTINAAKLTIGQDEYAGTVSGTTVTFTVPYATTASEVKGGSYVWSKSQDTVLSAITWETAAGKTIFDGTNTIEAEAVGGDKVPYSIVIKKADAKTGKTLDSLKLISATTSDDVNEDVTYTATVSGTKVTVTLPYSQKATPVALVPEFTVPDGAALYINKATPTTDLNKTPLESGYYAADHANTPKAPKTTIAAGNFVATTAKNFVVADEAAVLAVKSTVGDITIASLGDLAAYRDHVTVYTIEIKYADAETGAELSAFSGNDGKVGSTITPGAITITVPDSFKTNKTPFYPDFTASKLATVTFDNTSKTPLVTDSTVKATAGEIGEIRVNTAETGLEVRTAKGNPGTWEAITKIKVENEAKSVTNLYDITLKVAEAKTGALITSLKVNNTKGVIDDAAKTVKVELPYGTDLGAATIEVIASELSSVTTSLSSSDVTITAGKLVNATGRTVDASKAFTITVTSEDGNTKNTYTVTATAAQKFTDVPDGKYYTDWIYEAAQLGLISGKGNGTYGPTQTIKRKDFAVMIGNLMGQNAEELAEKYTTTAFTDVSDDYALKYIAYASDNGLMSGVGGGRFNPDGNITREMAATIVARALKLTGSPATAFTDADQISKWAKEGVDAAAAAEIVVGSAGRFNPKAALSRADAAIILVKAFKAK